MKRSKKLLAVIALGGTVLSADAIDRDAASIDSLVVKGAAYEEVDALAVQAHTEIALATEREAWALLAGIGYTDISPQKGQEADRWWIALGVRYYPATLTALSLTGHHMEPTRSYGLEANGVSLSVRQRFVSAQEVISPFVVLSATIEDAKVRSVPDDRHDFTHLVLAAELGCDFMLRSDLALSLTAGYSESEDLPGGLDSLADGWTASAGLVYFWD